jgi:hypothetical protein
VWVPRRLCDLVTGWHVIAGMTSPPCVNVVQVGLRRAALDGTHGMQRRVPPVVLLHPRPASRPGPAQGAPGDWGCRRPTTRADLLRLTQDGVDFGEQRDFLGNRTQLVPSPMYWAIAVRRRRSALPRRARWLDDRQHLTGRSSVDDLLSHDGGELVVIPERVAAYQHGSHLHTSISIELAKRNLCLKTYFLYD